MLTTAAHFRVALTMLRRHLVLEGQAEKSLDGICLGSGRDWPELSQLTIAC